ncbi:uncharacterized protein LOC124407748 isoform X2 [Diprion similis]|uniref:uncharacterized protein LOC124407748 isoform X1 n=2 Tax=Diprion similis TaxID=362088 RepID=UPI001EF8544A|nr:uncharacterized protein LOC124407748 isoform X1 [Diprion similis]XP_046740174.1 uncharacterized protein LOC124407748 isoform X1 [Diprion similis]XP_046740175.1 uncharacterized protein LOC124407748 isoform X2 [Diprion similis]
MVGGLRERDYQRAVQKRNEACRRFDNHCQAARYFERESRLAEHFNSWSSRGSYRDNKFIDGKSKAERLRRRQNSLRKMLRDEDAGYRGEIAERAAAGLPSVRDGPDKASVDELRKQLDMKKAEKALYYPHNYGCFQSCSGPCECKTGGACSRHYQGEHHIDACRNSNLSMDQTNLRNYSTDCQSRKENPENRHHGEKRHIQGHMMYGSNIDSFGNSFTTSTVKHTGERRHYETATDSVDEGSNQRQHREDADQSSTASSVRQMHEDQESVMGYAGHAAISERRHYGNPSNNSGRSLANTNMSQASPSKHVSEMEKEAEAEREAEDHEETVCERRYATADQELEQIYESCNRSHASSPGCDGFTNKKNSSTDNINFSWKYDDPAKHPVCFLTHSQLLEEIQDLESREVQVCKKQNWGEALRLRDMRNRLELQREVEIFNCKNLVKNKTKRLEMTKLADRMELMDKRESSGNDHLIYSEEAKSLWEARVREDNAILSKDERAAREKLLQELEEEWEMMSLNDKERVAETPVKQHHSYLQEELDIRAEAIENAVDLPHVYRSNDESKSSCTRNKDKGSASLIFLG